MTDEPPAEEHDVWRTCPHCGRASWRWHGDNPCPFCERYPDGTRDEFPEEEW